MIDSKGLRLLIGDQVVQVNEDLSTTVLDLGRPKKGQTSSSLLESGDLAAFQWFWREWAPRTGYVLDVGNLRAEYEQYADVRERVKVATHAAEMARKEVEIVALNTETQMYRQKLESGAYMGVMPQNPPTSDFVENDRVLPWKGKQ